ncbi:hypothetical protein Agub_g4233 [Astrephomene gubernaculifera]|uniref:Uncharacterized protein n=1 Tax=Astrephomene gubernaculifera TaxID=47775 RepID=A0AAD3DKD9_9CHLO|nr:hypothetical protein Agub_g4233 [Astrephomene gubernaculifera]
MSADVDESDFDVEAAFEAELARLSEASDTGASSCEWPADGCHNALPKAFLTLGDNHSSDGSDEDEAADSSGEAEPESFQRLRAALQRREAALEEFGRDMQQVQQEIEGVVALAATAAAAATTGDNAAATVAASLGGALSETGSGAAPAVTASAAGVGPGGADPTAASVPRPDGGLAANRRRLQEAYQAEEAARKAERERQRQEAEAAAAREAAEAEERVRRQVEALEKQRFEALAALEAQKEAAAAEAEALLAAAAAERDRLATEQAATAVRMEAAARAAAAREAAREAAMEALRQETLAMARPHIAALRIAHAWRRYRYGPVRAARVAAAVRIQASWRGFVDRRHAARLRQQRDMMRKLEELASKGLLEELRAAAERAKDIGQGDAVLRRLSALESAAGDTAARLSAAAAGGSVMAFRAALAAAQRFPHLAELAASSSELFERRRTEAAAAVQAAVEVQPMSEFTRLLEAAGAVGADPQALTAALEAVRRRDAQLAAALAAAASARGAAFDLEAFTSLAERGLQLGLKGDVAAARHTLERRRRALAADMRDRGSSCSAAEAAALAAEARRLGLQAEVEGLQQQLRRRQGEIQAALELAATHDSSVRFSLLLRQAADLGVVPTALQGPQEAFVGRHAAAREALAAAASTGTLRAFLSARCAAARCGVGLTELLAADRSMGARRRAVGPRLVEALRLLWQTCGAAGPQLWMQPQLLLDAGEAFGRALGLSDVRAILRRALRAPASSGGAMSAAARGPEGLWQAATRRPQQQPVLQTQGPGTELAASVSAPSGQLRELLRGLWGPAVLSLSLGLPDRACLALSALRLQGTVAMAEGSYVLRAAHVPLDYWGVPQLRQWQQQQQPAASARAAGGSVRQSAGDELAVRLAAALQRGSRAAAVWCCTAAVDPQAIVDGWRSFLPARAGRTTAPDPLTRNGTRQQPALTTAAAAPSSLPPQPPPRSAPVPCGPAVPLTRAVILRNAPLPAPPSAATAASSSSSCGPAATPVGPCLERLTRLDLGLERLGSLAGLDVLCPSLRCLTAPANQLSSLEGLSGLTRLRELQLRGNQLAGLCDGGGGAGAGGAGVRRDRGVAQGSSGPVWCLPGGGSLRRLVLDSNCLSGRLSGLEGCSGLRSLSLADNSLTELGCCLEACSASLTCLLAAGNCLASLAPPHCCLAGCTALRCLDVSGNRLTSLEGIQGLVLLQSLGARGNQLTALPRPLCLPYLTALDLSQNALQGFWGTAAPTGDTASGTGDGSSSSSSSIDSSSSSPRVLLPSLEHLNLCSNRIVSIGPFSPLSHLTSLDLSFNNLASLAALQHLTALTRLQQLNLGDNPATDMQEEGPPPGPAVQPGGQQPQQLLPGRAAASAPHRRVVLALLPWLRELDHEEVAEGERARGEVLAVAASPVAAVAMMRALRTGTGLAGGLCVPVGTPGYPAVSSASGSAGVVYAGSSCSSSSKRSGSRSRSGARGAAAGPRLQYAGLCPATAERLHPAARRSLLTSLATSSWPSSSGAAVSSSPCYDVGSSSSSGSTQRDAKSRADAAPNGPQPGSRVSTTWLTHTEQSWRATLPYDMAEVQRRQLAVLQSLAPQGLGDCAGAGKGASKAGTPLPPSQLALACSGVSSSTTVRTLLHEGGLLDFAPMRGFRPAARALQRLNLGGSGRTASTIVFPGAGGSGVSAEALAAEAEVRYESAEATAHQRLAAELRQAVQPLCSGAASSSGAAHLPQPQPVLLPQPSYFWRRVVCDAGAAATIIQSYWRGMRARRLAAVLRSDQYQARCCAAATSIQAWWRGHRVRCGRQLAALRAAAAAERAARRQQEERRRHAAAVTIQAHVRGHLVRRRLRAALAAARLGPGGGSDAEDEDLFGGSGELGDMLAFLQPLEKLFLEERPQQGPVAGQWGPGGPQQQPMRPPMQGAGVPAAAAAAAGPSGAEQIGPAGLRPLPPLAWAAPAAALSSSPSLAAGGFAAYDPAALVAPPGAVVAPAAPPVPSVLPSNHLTEQQLVARPVNPFASADALPPLQRAPPPPPPGHPPHTLPGGGVGGFGGGPRPAALTIAEGSADYTGLDPRWQSGEVGEAHGGEYGNGQVCDTPVSQADSVTPSSQERRQQRHLERLRALMAEWGFKDLATAEAYYRRTLRAKQGQTRKKLEDKYRNPALRLQKLQQQVEARQGYSPGAARPSPHAPAAAAAASSAALPPPPAAPPGRPPLPLEHGLLPRGPDRPATVRSDSGGNTGARPLRNVNSADGILTGAASGGSSHSPAGALPALRHHPHRDGERSSNPLLGPLRTGGSGGSASPAVLGPSSRLPSGGGSTAADDEDWLSVQSFGSVGSAAARGGARASGAGDAAKLRGGWHGAAAQPQSHPRGRPVLPALANNWMAMSPSQTPPLPGTGDAALQRRPMGPGRSPGK